MNSKMEKLIDEITEAFARRQRYLINEIDELAHANEMLMKYKEALAYYPGLIQMITAAYGALEGMEAVTHDVREDFLEILWNVLPSDEKEKK